MAIYPLVVHLPTPTDSISGYFNVCYILQNENNEFVCFDNIVSFVCRKHATQPTLCTFRITMF